MCKKNKYVQYMCKKLYKQAIKDASLLCPFNTYVTI